MNKQIVLRKYDVEKDLPFFHRVHSDVASMKFYGMHAFISFDESRKLMNDYLLSEQSGKSIHRVICDEQRNEYLGEIGLFNIHPLHHRADSYCLLLPEQRKKGLSVLASALIYREAFEHLGINRVQALVDSRNEMAVKSLVGIGFFHEGRLRHYECIDGEYIDMEIFSLLKSDFYDVFGK